MKDKKYTHLAEMYGFRCYINIHTYDMEGTTVFNALMIRLCIWIEINIGVNGYFPIKLIKEL